jgi:septum formation protein
MINSSNQPEIILASGSETRLRLLRNAGLSPVQRNPMLDEAPVKQALKSEFATAAQAAETLGELKAIKVSSNCPDALVIGSDQILEINNIWFDKPVDREQAAAHLIALSGKTHSLYTSVTVVKNMEPLWHYNSVVRLTMHPLSSTFIDTYLEKSGPSVMNSVGAYQLEGTGVQLFSVVDGDFFSVLGLPLLPLLSFLREQKVLKD